MSLSAIIVEDELDSQLSLKNMLNKFCEGIQVVATVNRVHRAVQVIKELQPDIVFLDIELPNEKGFALFDYFPAPSFEVIFTTAYNQYALKAFKLSAIDYLLKPIDIDELRNAIRLVQEKKSFEVNQQRLEILKENLNSLNQRLALPTMEGYSFVELKNILYCEAQGNYTTFYLLNQEKIMVSKILKIYANLLQEFNFFRVSRSHLVNINHVKKYGRSKSPTVTMNDGTTVNVSVNRREAFLDQINRLLS